MLVGGGCDCCVWGEQCLDDLLSVISSVWVALVFCDRVSNGAGMDRAGTWAGFRAGMCRTGIAKFEAGIFRAGFRVGIVRFRAGLGSGLDWTGIARTGIWGWVGYGWVCYTNYSSIGYGYPFAFLASSCSNFHRTIQ